MLEREFRGGKGLNFVAQMTDSPTTRTLGVGVGLRFFLLVDLVRGVYIARHQTTDLGLLLLDLSDEFLVGLLCLCNRVGNSVRLKIT